MAKRKAARAVVAPRIPRALRAVAALVTCAQVLYRRALQIDPASAAAHYQHAVLLRGLGRREEAQQQFSAACAARMPAACAAVEQLKAAQ